MLAILHLAHKPPNNPSYKFEDEVLDYELSEISAIGYKTNKLEIFIDGEQVEYSLSELE